MVWEAYCLQALSRVPPALGQVPFELASVEMVEMVALVLAALVKLTKLVLVGLLVLVLASR